MNRYGGYREPAANGHREDHENRKKVWFEKY
jgi:hypothetical protein